ncbi:MAG: FliM/FliN family flagellar motor switch protein [Paracoccaceae bacterium]
MTAIPSNLEGKAVESANRPGTPLAQLRARKAHGDLAERLPSLDRATADMLDRIAALPDRLWASVGHGAAAVEVTFRTALPLPRLVLSVPVACAFGAFSLEIDPAAVDAVCDDLLPSWRNEAEAALPRDWRAVMVVSHLLAAAQLGEPPPVIGIMRSHYDAQRPNRAAETALGTLYGADGHAWGFRLHLHHVRPDAPMALSWPVTNRVDQLPALMPAAMLVIDGPRVEGKILRDMRIGDALVLPKTRDGEIAARLIVPGLLSISGEISLDGALTLTTEMTMLDPSDRDLPFARHPDASDESDVRSETISALRLKVDLILPSPYLTLAEIGRLGPGASLDLAGDLEGPVTIAVSGQTLGSGRLVRIGARIAVQIDRWAAGREPRDAG